MAHCTPEQLEAYSRNETPENELEAIEIHLLICEQCRAALEALEDYGRTMREALADDEPDEQPGPSSGPGQPSPRT